MSIIKANKWQTTVGNTVSTVLQTQTTPMYAVSTSSATFVSSGYSVTITPYFTNSRFLVKMWSGMNYSGGNSAACEALFYRTISGSTVNLPSSAGMGYGSFQRANGVALYTSMTNEFIDTPNTTAPITYTAYFKADVAGNTVWLVHPSAYGYITVMEIAQ